jgi:hypothetical protein
MLPVNSVVDNSNTISFHYGGKSNKFHFFFFLVYARTINAVLKLNGNELKFYVTKYKRIINLH